MHVRPHNSSFLGISWPRKLVMDDSETEFHFQSHESNQFAKYATSPLVQSLILPELLQIWWILGLPEVMRILCMRVWSRQNHHPCLEGSCSKYQLPAGCQNDASSRSTFRLPKKLTSCEFTLFSISGFTESSFVMNFSGTGSVSFGLWPSCPPQPETAQWILSWVTEWMMRKKSSVFEASAVKCTVSFPFTLPRIPRRKALTLLFHRIFVPSLQRRNPISLQVCDCAVSFRLQVQGESLRVLPDFFGIWDTFLFISISCPINVVEHRHGDDPSTKIFRFNVLASQITLHLLKNLQWCTSWENAPLELYWFSINTEKFLIDRKSVSWPFHLCFASEGSDNFPRHKTESKYTRTYDFVHLITCRRNNLHLIHEGSVRSIAFTFRIPSEWPNTNLWVMLNRSWISQYQCSWTLPNFHKIRFKMNGTFHWRWQK